MRGVLKCYKTKRFPEGDWKEFEIGVEKKINKFSSTQDMEYRCVLCTPQRYAAPGMDTGAASSVLCFEEPSFVFENTVKDSKKIHY